MAVLRRTARAYGAMMAMVPKLFMAYQIWVWMQFIVQIISLVILVSFWSAVYAGESSLSGLTLAQTLNYIILAQIFAPSTDTNMVFELGYMVRSGQIGMRLIQPLDLQLALYVQKVSEIALAFVFNLPLALIGWLLFRYHVPADPLVWLAFLVSLLIGNALLFCFDWILACASFYSTEVWGMGMLRYGVALFFSGALVPLAMMPGWLRTISTILPFSQALYTPVSLLSGITPLSGMPRIWLAQLAALVALGALSRFTFSRAVRQVTVQGG
ncbi:MAG: ABC-2 family transporter protein [Anaerolineae bacterium]|nr:ABC-2 family transporter protein [Anaerolineae bacterium]